MPRQSPPNVHRPLARGWMSTPWLARRGADSFNGWDRRRITGLQKSGEHWRCCGASPRLSWRGSRTDLNGRPLDWCGTRGLDDLPLIVLTRGKPAAPRDPGKAAADATFQAAWMPCRHSSRVVHSRPPDRDSWQRSRYPDRGSGGSSTGGSRCDKWRPHQVGRTFAQRRLPTRSRLRLRVRVH